MQTFTAPVTGNYKLEVWGGASGKKFNNGEMTDWYACGGYSYGNYIMNRNQTIYVSVGGKGEDGQFESRSQGGWNGGGNGDWDHADDDAMGGGGGCTSIQKSLKEDGQLKNYELVKNTDVLIVAGGAGSVHSPIEYGYGGGETGCITTHTMGTYVDQQATQNSGYAFGLGQTVTGINNCDLGAGGGGWYGGYTIIPTQAGVGVCGGGGSGHIGTMLTNGTTIAGNQTFPSPSGGTETGHSGDGYAIITWQQLPQ